MSARRVLVIVALAALGAGCGVDVDLHGLPGSAAPASVARLGGPTALEGEPTEVPLARIVTSGDRAIALRGRQAWLFAEDGAPTTAPFEADAALPGPYGFAITRSGRTVLVSGSDGATFPPTLLANQSWLAGSSTALLAAVGADLCAIVATSEWGSLSRLGGDFGEFCWLVAEGERGYTAAGADFAALSAAGLRVLRAYDARGRAFAVPGIASGSEEALACDASACLVVQPHASWIVELETGAVTTVAFTPRCEPTDGAPLCAPFDAVALGDGRFLVQDDERLVRLSRAGVEAQTAFARTASSEAAPIAVLGRTAFLAHGLEALLIRDAAVADPLVLEPWTTLPPAPRAAPNPAGAASACAGDVCVVPALGLVSRTDGTQIGGPQLDAQVASDGHDFYFADGHALKRLVPGGTPTRVGEEQCTHVAWTGTAVIASCRELILRLEGDRLVHAGNPLFAPFASVGITLVALIGTGHGALAVGFRESATDDTTIWAAPLDARGLVAGEPRLVARSPFANEVRALGSRDRVLIAWPGFGDPFPRVVTHVAVLDATGGVVAPPHAPLPRSAAGTIASDGAGWLFAWTDPRDSEVRVVRFDRDGGLVPDLASGVGIDLGAFPFESAVGLESGPYLLFGAGRQRTLRFLPATD